MRYRSNLTMPEITGFKLLDPPKQIMGHDAPSDPDFEPDCTYWTHDEAAILYNVFRGPHCTGGLVVDIGARFGWTSKVIHMATRGEVECVDPHFVIEERRERFLSNTGFPRGGWMAGYTSQEYFQFVPPTAAIGYVIDGNHDSPEPLNDAINAARFAAPDCIAIFHDFWGRPIRDGVEYLMGLGWKCRVYMTPNGVACCWRGHQEWFPPCHIPDSNINWAEVRQSAAPEFDFGRCI